MDDLDDNLRVLTEHFKTDDPLPRFELDDRARRVRRRRRASLTGIVALVTVIAVVAAAAAASIGDHKKTQELQVTASTTIPKSTSGVASKALPSEYLFNEISPTKDGLVLTGEVGASTSTCASAAVDSTTLAVGYVRPHDCNVQLAAGNVEVVSKWLSTDNIEVSVVPIDRATGQNADGHVVMTYSHSSDTDAVAVAEGQWLWLYDVATANGPELLQISAATGAVVGTVAMPQVFRPIMAANDDGVWLGPSVTGGGPAGLYQVRSGAKTATVVVSEPDSVCWLVASGHDLWAGIGRTCLQQMIERFHGSDPRPVFEVPERGYDPLSVVGNAADGLWTMQWAPAVGTAINPAPRRQNIVRIDPITGAETVTATLSPLAVPISATGGLDSGQGALFAGSLYLLEPPFRRGDYFGYSRLVRVKLTR